MISFPSIAWCRALVAEAQKEPEILQVAKEWAGRSVGVVVKKGPGLERDFCVFARPSPTSAELDVLTECEDEDDLELEEPDFLFVVPWALAQKLLRKELDPLSVLRGGQLRAEGDMRFLVPFAQRWQPLGDRVYARLAARH